MAFMYYYQITSILMEFDLFSAHPKITLVSLIVKAFVLALTLLRFKEESMESPHFCLSENR